MKITVSPFSVITVEVASHLFFYKLIILKVSWMKKPPKINVSSSLLYTETGHMLVEIPAVACVIAPSKELCNGKRNRVPMKVHTNRNVKAYLNASQLSIKVHT